MLDGGATRAAPSRPHREHVARRIEPPLPATVRFVVGFGRDITDQLVEIIEIPFQHDTTVRDARPKIIRSQAESTSHQAAQRRRHLCSDHGANLVTADIVDTGGPEIERRPFPTADHAFSPHETHRHWIDGGMSTRSTSTNPGQARRPGRRRQGSALTQSQAGVAGGRSTHEGCQVLGHAPSGRRRGSGQVEEVAKVRDVHGA